jgi:hypothetical protein
MAAMETAGAESRVRLFFRSRAMWPPGSPDSAASLSAILRSSRANNPSYGITGVLLFDDTLFLQVLEGPLGHLEQLYELIARDLRHEAIEVIDFLPTEARDYEGLALAYLHVTETAYPTLRHVMSRSVQGVAPTLCTTITEALAGGSGAL